MYIIAEIGQAHEGSLGLALSYIDALAETGVDSVKFQVHIAEAESSEYETFRIKFSQQDKTRFDYWKRMEFSLEEWNILKLRCEEKGMEFMASPFSNTAVDLLEKLEVKTYKVGSGEVNNFLLLEKIAQTGKPLILSSGMSSYEELDGTVEYLKMKEVDFSILQCTTSYPTKPHQYGLNVIEELRQRYQVPVGYSDHSGLPETCLAAATLGAEILEFHAVFDRRCFGPDATSSLEIEEIINLVRALKNIEISLQNPVDKHDNVDFSGLKEIFEKSLAINRNLPAGHKLGFEDLEAKKPKNYGIETSQYIKVIGRKLKKDMKQWEFLNWDDIY